MRLDKELCSRGLARSRTLAAALIAEGRVSVDSRVVTKPSFDVAGGAVIEVVAEP